jgi:hypothetical protein
VVRPANRVSPQPNIPILMTDRQRADTVPADHGWAEHYVTGARGALHGARWDRYRELAARGESALRD